MSTLNELIHYCNEDDPIGALMLTGEWGCGKTYLIQKELSKALKDTHIIVRVSLFGMNSASTLRDAVRKRWFEACMPFIDTLQKAQRGGVFRAFSSMLYRVNPLAGGAAGVVVNADVEDFIPIKPEFEDLKTHEKKKVILVYDDLERAKMDFAEVLGVINDFCENHRFNSIISVNEESLRPEIEKDPTTYQLAKEKTISQVLYHIPDYNEVISSILDKTNRQTPEYKEYLLSNEELIRQVFVPEKEAFNAKTLFRGDRKNHNFRTLKKAMQNFYRIYADMEEAGKEVTTSHLYSFLAYYLVAKGGLLKDGKPHLTFEDKDIQEFYPQYSPESMTDMERGWIVTGIWNKDSFLKEIEDIKQ